MLKTTPTVFKTLFNTGSQNKNHLFQTKFISTTISYNDKSANRQAKVFNKFFGNRLAGSKKKWYPEFGGQGSASQQHMPTVSSFSKTKKQGKNATRRVTVLNKLFMKHITDLLATGEASSDIVGKGLEISRVQVFPDFLGVNVFWIAKGDANDKDLEEALKHSAGLIRHELSQLRLMGEVPRIFFVKDKIRANMAEVEVILKQCDFGDDYEQQNSSNQLRHELNLESWEETKKNPDEDSLPDMRHDILGLDHKDIMMKILTKMRKSKLAWELHEQGENTQAVVDAGASSSAIEKLQQKIKESEENSADFEKFLSKRKFRKNSSLKNQYDEYFDYQGSHNYDDNFRENEDGDFIEDYEEKK